MTDKEIKARKATIEFLREVSIEVNDHGESLVYSSWEINEAIKALEKKVPKKPNGNYCPICKWHLRCPKRDTGYSGKVKNRKGDDYCPNCGQALDWSEENVNK